MSKTREGIERVTGELFGSLFSAYDDRAFHASMELFRKRFEANGFPVEWFEDKVCLDAGGGGGRYSIALSLLGAKEVYNLDVSKTAIGSARRQAMKLGIINVKSLVGSVEDIPFPNEHFDSVIFSGVLHHIAHPEKAMADISRVLRPGGLLYMLVYATGGVRWPLVQVLRPIAQMIGFEVMDMAIKEAGLPVNKRRTYLDDLFVPLVDFYTWGRIESMAERNGFENLKRFNEGRFDHEENLRTYFTDLEGFKVLFSSGAQSNSSSLVTYRRLFKIGERMCKAVLDYINEMIHAVQTGQISEDEAKWRVIGQGHHRVVAWKAGSIKQ